MSIRLKTLAIVSLPLLLLGGAFFIYSRNTSANYMRLRMDSVRQEVEFTSEKVNKVIGQMERNAIDVATSGTILHALKVTIDVLAPAILIENIDKFPVPIGGGLWYEPNAFGSRLSRVCYYALRDKKTGRVYIDPDFASDAYDYPNQNWYTEIAEDVSRPGMTAWSRPYYDQSGSSELMTTVGSGMFDKDGTFIGMSTIDWELNKVVASLNDIKPTPNSFVLFSVPSENYVISNSANQDNLGTGTNLTDIEWYKQLPKPEMGETIVAPFTFAKVSYFAFRRKMDNGWMLSVNVPRKEIFAELEKRNRFFSILLSAISLALLALAWRLMSTFVNKPIAGLIHDIRALGKGNLDARVRVRKNDEIGQVGTAFNKMTEELKESLEKSAHEQLERERIASELNVATLIQTSMLPCTFPAFPERGEFDIHATMQPAREVGGDFYDFFLVDDKTLAVVIADVSGKGVAAALFMIIARMLLKNNAQYGKSPEGVFTAVNKLLCENNEADMFVTAFMGYLEIPTGAFTYVNAGHNPPLLARENGSFSELPVQAGLPLAIFEGTIYRQDSVQLGVGDTLFLYTDGITEAMNGSDELFGVNRLLESADASKSVSLEDMLVSIKHDISVFENGAEQADDITMLALRMTRGKKTGADKLVLDARQESLYRVQAYISEKLREGGVPEGAINQIAIVAEELFVNIANYAYGNMTGEATVSAWVEGRDAVLLFSDGGTAFNPLEAEEPDVHAPIEERDIGGLGIFMARQIMDSMEYRREDDRNVLVARKKF